MLPVSSRVAGPVPGRIGVACACACASQPGFSAPGPTHFLCWCKESEQRKHLEEHVVVAVAIGRCRSSRCHAKSRKGLLDTLPRHQSSEAGNAVRGEGSEGGRGVKGVKGVKGGESPADGAGGSALFGDGGAHSGAVRAASDAFSRRRYAAVGSSQRLASVKGIRPSARHAHDFSGPGRAACCRKRHIAVSACCRASLCETSRGTGWSAATGVYGNHRMFFQVLSLLTFFAPTKKVSRPRGRNPRLQSSHPTAGGQSQSQSQSQGQGQGQGASRSPHLP